MEHSTQKTAPIDLMGMIGSLLPVLKRLWLLGTIVTLLCTGAAYLRASSGYVPMYQATASFTVRVVNPLYASVSTYNSETAAQMARTFPHILTSDPLKKSVKEFLGVSYVPEVVAEVIPGTNVFTLRVTDADPQYAYDVLQAVIACYPEVAEFVVGPTYMVLLDESGVPQSPVGSSSVLIKTLAGLMVGLVVWCGAAVIVAAYKNTVRNEDELKELLNCPCLGTLPAAKMIQKNITHPLMAYDSGKTGFVDAMELIYLHLERELNRQKKNVVLVSSALPSEGKTTVSTNLAIAAARKGKNTLLIDCDLRNPSVASAFSIQNHSGLSEVLDGEIPVREGIYRTSVPNLYIMTAGSSHKTHLSRQLSSDRMSMLLDAVKITFDMVILDTSPCGLIADTSEIAELAECAVMVVRRDYSSRSQILDGTRFLTDSKLPLVGAILNGTQKSSRNGYDYGYGYGNAYGYK